MKKLIAMIGAVAMAFGLFADSGTPAASYYSTSFEPGYDTGCTSDPAEFAPETAGWTAGTTTETCALDTYATGEGYAYPKTGTGLRRESLFLAQDSNTKYLKLETGDKTLGKALGTGEIFIDQTVKFTGFEETLAADAVENGQLAVWASAIEADENGEGVETNLYARVGTGSGYADVKIVENIDLDDWYRVTIKAIGNVIDSAKGDEIQAGFLVYLNGAPATIVAADQSYSTVADHFTTTAASYYSKGLLFTGISTTSATITKVEFQGLGSIDDFITSVEAPDFAAEVEFSFTAPTGATLDKVYLIDGQEEIELTELKAMPNSTIKATFTADAGYRLDTSVWQGSIGDGGAIDVSTTIKPIEGYATLNGAIKGEAELADMMANLQANDAVAFIKNGSVTNGVDETSLYDFTKNTSIDVGTDGAWTLTVMNSDTAMPGTFTINAPIANSITAAFENGDELDVYAAAIPAGVTVDASDANGLALFYADDLSVAGTLKINAAATFAGKITLVDAGKVWSAAKLAYEGDESIFTNEKVAEAGDAQSGYTYTIAAAPTTGFMIILADGTTTLYKDNFADAVAVADAGATIKLLSNADVQATGMTIPADKTVTLDLAGFTVTAANTEVGHIQVNGALTVTDTSNPSTGKIVSGATGTWGLIQLANAIGDSAASFTLTAGTIKTEYTYGIVLKGNGSTVAINGGTVEAYYMAIMNHGSKSTGTTITVNGGTVESTNDYAIYGATAGSITINDGTVAGAAGAVDVKAGTLDINGGEIAYTGGGNTGTGSDGTTGASNSVLYVKPVNGNTTVTLDGGTYTGAPVLTFAEVTGKTVTVTKASTLEIAAPEGYKWDDNGALYAKYNGNNTIANVRDLKDLQADVNAGQTFAGVTFTQTADIDLDGIEWTGIGPNWKEAKGTSLDDSDKAFSGVYDGGSFTIENLTLAKGTGAVGAKYTGFFAVTKNATIKNLTIEFAGFATGANEAKGGGVVVGHAAGNDTFINVTTKMAEGVDYALAQHNSAGFICFADKGATFTSCTNKVNLKQAADDGMKLAGFIANPSGTDLFYKFEDCVNEGDIVFDINAAKNEGSAGFIGYFQTATAQFINCENKSSNVPAQFVGHLQCYAGSNVRTEGSGNIGLAGIPAVRSIEDNDTYTYDNTIEGIKLATVENGKATFLASDADLVAGGAYAVYGPYVPVTFAFAAAGTISFDETLATVKEFRVTGDESLDVTSDKVGNVTTFTAALKKFDVTFVQGLNGETTNVVEGVECGKTVTKVPELATVVGYNAAWDGDTTAVITEAKTFTAVYTAIEYNVTFSTNTVNVAETATKAAYNTTLTPAQIPSFEGGKWDVDPATAVITCDTNFNYTIAAAYPEYIPETASQEVKDRYTAWAAKYGADTGSVNEDAYLLNCEPGKEDAAKENFKIANIKQDEDGNWVVTVVSDDGSTKELGQNDTYGNGYVNIFSVKATKFPTAGENSDFFQAELTVEMTVQ